MASVHKEKLKSGAMSYCVRWVDPNTRKPKNKRFRKSKLAHEFAAKIEVAHATGKSVDPSLGKVRVDEYVRGFVADRERVGEKTRNRYSRITEKHIVPRIGGRPIRDVSLTVAKSFMSDLKSDGVGVPTRLHVRALLVSCWSEATKEGLVSVNVWSATERPKYKRDEATFLSVDEVSRLAEACRQVSGRDQDATLVRFLAYTGLRFGEAAALNVSDLTLDGPTPTVVVTKSLTDVEGRLSVGTTKTGKKRSVGLVDGLRDDLVAMLEDEGRIGDPDAPVFQMAHGGPMRLNNWRPRVFDKAKVIAGIDDDATPHTLRHTFASMCAQNGITLLDTSRLLGHANIGITADTYSHIFPTTCTSRSRSSTTCTSPSHRSKSCLTRAKLVVPSSHPWIAAREVGASWVQLCRAFRAGRTSRFPGCRGHVTCAPCAMRR